MSGPWTPPLWLRVLASLRLTLFGIALLGLGTALTWDAAGEGSATWPLSAPLLLLALNLIAAIGVNGGFRAQLPLLLFHLALLAIVLLAAIGRLTYLRATTEVVTGAEFERLERIDAGPLHAGELARVHFRNQGFRIDYQPGMARDKTDNEVLWRDAQGAWHRVVIGDQVPLKVHGYRFYTTSNKGFAALLRWQPEHGEAQLGTVSFPSYPLYADKQSASWRLDRHDLRAQLNIAETLIDPTRASQFRLPRQPTLSIDTGVRIATLGVGDSLPLPGGQLRFVGLTTWMGYAVFYDATIPWLLAACALAALTLGWHFWRKFARRPWSAG